MIHARSFENTGELEGIAHAEQSGRRVAPQHSRTDEAA
jgi:hypothetical protein